MQCERNSIIHKLPLQNSLWSQATKDYLNRTGIDVEKRRET